MFIACLLVNVTRARYCPRPPNNLANRATDW
jgi:hypothetical protein